MRLFVEPTDAPAPKTKNILPISLLIVAVFVVMAVAQLYSYEDFPEVIASFWLPGSDQTAYLLAALFVSLEVLALPFLLGMRLSPAMRVFSMTAGWIVVGKWFALSVWVNVTANAAASAGVLGATIELPVGWWTVFLFAALGVLVAWVSWGRWPLRTMHKKPHRKDAKVV